MLIPLHRLLAQYTLKNRRSIKYGLIGNYRCNLNGFRPQYINLILTFESLIKYSQF